MSNAVNGFFGMIQGPFFANQELLIKIQEDCKDNIAYLSKIGIIYNGKEKFKLLENGQSQYFVRINNIQFQIGKTRMLEFQDVEITSIQFVQDVDDHFYIDYQYQKINENE